MERPTITIDGKKYEIKKLTGRDWRVFSEFNENPPEYPNADFLERNAAFIAEFYDGMPPEVILDKMPLEYILPASSAIRNYVTKLLVSKFERLEKTPKRTRHSKNILVHLRAISLSMPTLHERLSFELFGDRKHAT